MCALERESRTARAMTSLIIACREMYKSREEKKETCEWKPFPRWRIRRNHFSSLLCPPVSITRQVEDSSRSRIIHIDENLNVNFLRLLLNVFFFFLTSALV